MNVPAGAKIDCVIVGANKETPPAGRRLGGTRSCGWRGSSRLLSRTSVPKASAQIVLGEATVALPLEGVIDFAAERARLGKELEKIGKDIAAIEGRLGNPGFVAKAPEEVLEETRERKTELERAESEGGRGAEKAGVKKMN